MNDSACFANATATILVMSLISPAPTQAIFDALVDLFLPRLDTTGDVDTKMGQAAARIGAAARAFYDLLTKSRQPGNPHATLCGFVLDPRLAWQMYHRWLTLPRRRPSVFPCETGTPHPAHRLTDLVDMQLPWYIERAMEQQELLPEFWYRNFLADVTLNFHLHESLVVLWGLQSGIIELKKTRNSPFYESDPRHWPAGDSESLLEDEFSLFFQLWVTGNWDHLDPHRDVIVPGFFHGWWHHEFKHRFIDQMTTAEDHPRNQWRDLVHRAVIDCTMIRIPTVLVAAPILDRWTRPSAAVSNLRFYGRPAPLILLDAPYEWYTSETGRRDLVYNIGHAKMEPSIENVRWASTRNLNLHLSMHVTTTGRPWYLSYNRVRVDQVPPQILVPTENLASNTKSTDPGCCNHSKPWVDMDLTRRRGQVIERYLTEPIPIVAMTTGTPWWLHVFQAPPPLDYKKLLRTRFEHGHEVSPDTPLDFVSVRLWLGWLDIFKCKVCGAGPFEAAYEVTFEWGDTGKYEYVSEICSSCMNWLNLNLCRNGNATKTY